MRLFPVRQDSRETLINDIEHICYEMLNIELGIRIFDDQGNIISGLFEPYPVYCKQTQAGIVKHVAKMSGNTVIVSSHTEAIGKLIEKTISRIEGKIPISIHSVSKLQDRQQNSHEFTAMLLGYSSSSQIDIDDIGIMSRKFNYGYTTKSTSPRSVRATRRRRRWHQQTTQTDVANKRYLTDECSVRTFVWNIMSVDDISSTKNEGYLTYLFAIFVDTDSLLQSKMYSTSIYRMVNTQDFAINDNVSFPLGAQPIEIHQQYGFDLLVRKLLINYGICKSTPADLLPPQFHRTTLEGVMTYKNACRVSSGLFIKNPTYKLYGYSGAVVHDADKNITKICYCSECQAPLYEWFCMECYTFHAEPHRTARMHRTATRRGAREIIQQHAAPQKCLRVLCCYCIHSLDDYTYHRSLRTVSAVKIYHPMSFDDVCEMMLKLSRSDVNVINLVKAIRSSCIKIDIKTSVMQINDIDIEGKKRNLHIIQTNLPNLRQSEYIRRLDDKDSVIYVV